MNSPIIITSVHRIFAKRELFGYSLACTVWTHMYPSAAAMSRHTERRGIIVVELSRVAQWRLKCWYPQRRSLEWRPASRAQLLYTIVSLIIRQTERGRSAFVIWRRSAHLNRWDFGDFDLFAMYCPAIRQTTWGRCRSNLSISQYTLPDNNTREQQRKWRAPDNAVRSPGQYSVEDWSHGETCLMRG